MDDGLSKIKIFFVFVCLWGIYVECLCYVTVNVMIFFSIV